MYTNFSDEEVLQLAEDEAGKGPATLEILRRAFIVLKLEVSGTYFGHVGFEITCPHCQELIECSGETELDIDPEEGRQGTMASIQIHEVTKV